MFISPSEAKNNSIFLKQKKFSVSQKQNVTLFIVEHQVKRVKKEGYVIACFVSHKKYYGYISDIIVTAGNTGGRERHHPVRGTGKQMMM